MVEDRVIAALYANPVGMHDGNSIGAGSFDLFDLSEEIDPLLAVLLPVLRSSHLPEGVVVRVTRNDDDSGQIVREVRL